MPNKLGTNFVAFQGWLAFIVGAFLFSLSTVLIKIISTAPYSLNPLMSAFARFSIGFVASAVYAILRKVDLKPRNIRLVLWRGVLNTLAIVLFYGAVQFTTITNTNLLNLTYPAWIFIAGPLLTKERSPWYYGIFLGFTLVGAFLITTGGATTSFNITHINIGDILALGSGIVAAFGIAVLRQARKYDDTTTVIFWLFLIGCLITLIPTILTWSTPPDTIAWLCMIGAGLCGFIGQVLITYGYAWVSAAQGSLLSSSGILISVVLGSLIFGDSLNLTVLIGGLLILVSLVGVSGIFEDYRREHPRK